MKKSFMLVLLMLNAISAWSQSLVLLHNGKELGKNAVILCDTLHPLLGIMKVALGVKNLTNSPKAVQVRKISLSVLGGSSNAFCWGTTCYSGTTDVSATAVTIPAKSVDTSFYAEYDPASGDTGRSIVEYRFFDVDNRSDEVTVVIHFIERRGTGIHELLAGEYLHILPSGSRGMLKVSYCLKEKSRLLVQMLSGQLAGEYTLGPGAATENLRVPAGQGVVVYSLERAGRIVYVSQGFTARRNPAWK